MATYTWDKDSCESSHVDWDGYIKLNYTLHLIGTLLSPILPIFFRWWNEKVLKRSHPEPYFCQPIAEKLEMVNENPTDTGHSKWLMGSGYPLSWPGMGQTPLVLIWEEVPPVLTKAWGTALSWSGKGVPHPDLGRVYPPPSWPGKGVPHRQRMGVPPCVNWHTNWKYYLPPSYGCGR